MNMLLNLSLCVCVLCMYTMPYLFNGCFHPKIPWYCIYYIGEKTIHTHTYCKVSLWIFLYVCVCVDRIGISICSQIERFLFVKSVWIVLGSAQFFFFMWNVRMRSSKPIGYRQMEAHLTCSWIIKIHFIICLRFLCIDFYLIL